MAWNYDPISRGLKPSEVVEDAVVHVWAWNYDPISRGLKLGLLLLWAASTSQLLCLAWNYDPISRGLKRH